MDLCMTINIKGNTKEKLWRLLLKSVGHFHFDMNDRCCAHKIQDLLFPGCVVV